MAKKTPKVAKNLSEVMLRTAEEDLMLNAEILGFNQQGEMEGMKPFEKRKYLVKQVLESPVQVLNHLSDEDFILFKQLVDAPGISAVYAMTGALPPCVILDLIECHCDHDEGKNFYTMTDDLRDAVRPHLDKASDDFENKFRFYVESLVLGALNIYGCLTETQLKSLLKEYMLLEDDGTGVLEHIYPQSAAIQLCCFDFIDDYEETMYASPFILTIDEILAGREEHPEIIDLKHFDKDEVQEAGMMPTPEIPNPKLNQLLNILETEAGLTEQEAILTGFSVWQMMQHEKSPMDTFQQLLKMDSRLVIVLPQLSDYMNHCPRWQFFGYCSDDLFRKNGGLSGKPQISIGPNMRKAGYKEEDIQKMVDNMWDEKAYAEHDDYSGMMPFFAPAKVGRNDPCPCGSGKKYKNCCGREKIDKLP